MSVPMTVECDFNFQRSASGRPKAMRPGAVKEAPSLPLGRVPRIALGVDAAQNADSST